MLLSSSEKFGKKINLLLVGGGDNDDETGVN